LNLDTQNDKMISMSAQIRLRFPATGKLLEKFLNSLSQGRLTIPVSERYKSGQELELEAILPEVAEPRKIRTRIQSVSADGKSVEATVINREEVDKLLDQLCEIPAYNEFLEGYERKKIETEEIEEVVLRAEPGEQEEPEVVIISEPLRLRKDLVESAEKKELPKPEKPKGKKTPISREEVRVREEKPEPAEKPEAEAESEVKIKIVEAAEPTVISDPLKQLRSWLVRKEEKPEKEDEKARLRREEPEEEEKEIDLSEYAPVGRLIQSLVKAMLRSGYYSPEHPGSQQAKQGLYQEFRKALEKDDELGFMLQHRAGQAPEFLISGVSPEPITLKKLLGAGTWELFFPKYVEYFERKRLIHLCLKNSVPEDHFYRFVDIMSDPSVDKGEASESGRLLTRMLVDNRITAISAIFEDDLIYLESKLPWRVEMAIQRLAKDLKVLPLYKDIAPEELTKLKTQIVQDILRPLRRPELLKDIVLNVYLIARQVPGIVQEELEEAVLDNFPMNMLIPCSEYIFQELKRLQELKLETPEQKQVILPRIESVKGILKKIAVQVLMEDIEGTEEFMEQLFYHNIITFEELPPEVQEKINLKVMADEFQKQPYLWLGKFMEARQAEDLELFLKYFNKILPLLLGRRDYQCLYLITEYLSRLPGKKRALLAEQGIADLNQAVWAEQVPELIRILLEDTLGVRKGIEEIFLLLGEFGLQKLYDNLLEEKNPGRRKLLIEGLIRFGPKSIERLRGILKDPAKPANLQMLALEAIGRTKNKEDAEIVQVFLKHSRPELRAEAVSALVRILGPQALSPVEPLLKDPDLGVKKRAVAVLGFLAKNHQELRARLLGIAFNQEEHNEIRAQAIQELGRNPPETEEERLELEGKLLELISEGEGFAGRIRKRFSSQTEERDKPKLAVLDLLGKIGDKKALENLSGLRLAGKELGAKLDEVLKQLNLRLGPGK